MSATIVVEFNDPEEWLAELAELPPQDATVRITTLEQQRLRQYPIKQVYLVAGFRRGQILLRLRRFCGEVMVLSQGQPADEHSIKVVEALNRRVEELRAKLEALPHKKRLSVRAGMFLTEREAAITSGIEHQPPAPAHAPGHRAGA